MSEVCVRLVVFDKACGQRLEMWKWMAEEEESSGVGLGICSWTRYGSTNLLISVAIAPVLRRDAKVALPYSGWLAC